MLKPGMYISDRYEIIEKVGSGGMADVYKARCHRLNRFVAIKVLKSEYSNDTSFVMKFRAEAQSAAGLSHPNIVNVYDVGDDDGLYYIVMELVEGITLKNFIERKGKLEIREAVGIAIQICQGLEAAHDNHIIHRDIKPQNIIISKEGKVKVTDFGIAKAATSNTINSNAMGSVHYISPEQARGGYSDEKSDIYSLGVTLYEMLSGRVPFAGENTVSVALAHIQSEAVPLRQINPDIPYSLEQIVMKCMEKKPERRYLSAAELIADLKRSIVNPNGDFVKVVSAIVDDSPTINLSHDEVEQIKSAAKVANEPVNDVLHEEPVAKRVAPAAQEEQKHAAGDDFDDLDSEDEDHDIDPKLDKIMVIGSVVLAVILAVIIIVIVLNVTGIFGRKSSSKLDPTASPVATTEVTSTPTPEVTATPTAAAVNLPDVVGKTYSEAKMLLDEQNIRCTFKEDNNSTESKDTVTRVIMDGTDISTGTTIPSDKTVEVYYSTGSNSVIVPNVVGKGKSSATTALKNKSIYNIEYQEEYSDTVSSGVVIRTNPSSGETMSKSDTITVTISKGKEVKNVAVPSLAGKTEDEAISELEDAGLKVGSKKKEYSDSVEEGKVISQGTEAGSQVPEGTKISFVISKGPKATPSPTPTQTPTFKGTVKIDPNDVFDAAKDEDGNPSSGKVEAYVTVDGKKISVISAQMMSYSDFPYTRTITGPKSGEYVLTILVDGVQRSGTRYVDFNQ
ncbi:MAG: Stk1 family PASTA domain-containing Ser/Thr kinase [bacterium]|nr:Stk1 family PASTA domain-containing Ser/Thr kinase [bacterium]